MPENCIYRTIELFAGEKFVLPAGAEVLAVSDSSLIESSCGGSFPTQELVCYYMQWAVNVDVEGIRQVFLPTALPIAPSFGPIELPNMNNAWDPDDDETDATITILNVGVAGQVIPGGFSCQSLTSLESTIAANPINGLVTNRKFQHFDVFDTMSAGSATNFFGPGNYGSSGYTLYGMWFKALEEIGNTVYVEIQGNSGNTGTPTRYYAQQMDCADFPNTSEVASSSGGMSITPTSTTTTTTEFHPEFSITTTTTTSTTTTTTVP